MLARSQRERRKVGFLGFRVSAWADGKVLKVGVGDGECTEVCV